ncbi:MAP kinase-activating death domain protein [Fasciola hepatica]|uniref:MAP kinase-activating death domain protein n=1 Tax=Fasciola hepatica TaxID=6192 RepID=A0A4E0QTY0_FASHE|nr:MAP kinase-activating death domain protein [Fasciola hepatica]
MIHGLEQTCTNHGIGGLASAMSLLEICHTHFVELQPDQRKNNNSQMMMDKRGDSKQHEEHFVDNLNSKIGSKIASQMAGIFFKANRLIGASEPKQNQTDPKIASEPSKLVRCVTGANDVESESDSASSEGTSNGHQYKHSTKTISNTDSAWSVQKNVRKSRSSGPYRFVNGELISCNEAQTTGVTGAGSMPSSTAGDDSNRVYLYEALVQPKQRSRLWDHMQFWEDTFFDTVAQERDMMGIWGVNYLNHLISSSYLVILISFNNLKCILKWVVYTTGLWILYSVTLVKINNDRCIPSVRMFCCTVQIEKVLKNIYISAASVISQSEDALPTK